MLLDQVLAHTDTAGVSGDAAVARFSDVHVLAPRGRFDVDMLHGHVNLAGQVYMRRERVLLLLCNYH